MTIKRNQRSKTDYSASGSTFCSTTQILSPSRLNSQSKLISKLAQPNNQSSFTDITRGSPPLRTRYERQAPQSTIQLKNALHSKNLEKIALQHTRVQGELELNNLTAAIEQKDNEIRQLSRKMNSKDTVATEHAKEFVHKEIKYLEQISALESENLTLRQKLMKDDDNSDETIKKETRKLVTMVNESDSLIQNLQIELKYLRKENDDLKQKIESFDRYKFDSSRERDKETIEKLKKALSRFTKNPVQQVESQTLLNKIDEQKEMQQLLIEENRKVKQMLIDEQSMSAKIQEQALIVRKSITDVRVFTVEIGKLERFIQNVYHGTPYSISDLVSKIDSSQFSDKKMNFSEDFEEMKLAFDKLKSMMSDILACSLGQQCIVQ